jgi:predicted RNase H-like HicB family nuclease
MKYAYPVIFTPEDGKILADFPDLKNIHTFGDDIADALDMAKDAVEMWLWDAENKKTPIPSASDLTSIWKKCDSTEQFVSLVSADTEEYRRQNDNRAVKKTLSLPAWLNSKAEQANAPFSQILQQGLKEYLKLQ